MSYTGIDIPDHLGERGDPGYSSDVSTALLDIYPLLARHAYSQAYPLLLNLRSQRMSLRQRIRVLYALGSVELGLGYITDAIGALDEVMFLSLGIDDLGALAEASFLQYAAYHQLQQFTRAAQCCERALTAWKSYLGNQQPDAHDLTFQIDILDALALEYFYAGHLPHSAHSIQSARNLLPLIPPSPTSPMRAAALEWTSALIERWQHRPDAAFQHALRAFDVYATVNPPADLARLRIVLADIILDMVSSDGVGRAFDTRDRIFTMAEPHLAHALAQTSTANDPSAHGMALLAYARYNRLARHEQRMFHVIDSVSHTAEELADFPLLGQAYTGLADELAVTGERESSLKWHHMAVDVLATSEAPVLSMWSRRALIKAGEFHTDR
jgi:tetratricopeptide (TPR) repeat protein